MIDLGLVSNASNASRQLLATTVSGAWKESTLRLAGRFRRFCPATAVGVMPGNKASCNEQGGA